MSSIKYEKSSPLITWFQMVSTWFQLVSTGFNWFQLVRSRWPRLGVQLQIRARQSLKTCFQLVSTATTIGLLFENGIQPEQTGVCRCCYRLCSSLLISGSLLTRFGAAGDLVESFSRCVGGRASLLMAALRAPALAFHYFPQYLHCNRPNSIKICCTLSLATACRRVSLHLAQLNWI